MEQLWWHDFLPSLKHSSESSKGIIHGTQSAECKTTSMVEKGNLCNAILSAAEFQRFVLLHATYP